LSTVSAVRFNPHVTVVLPCGTSFCAQLQRTERARVTVGSGNGSGSCSRRRMAQGRNAEDLDKVAERLYVGALDAAEKATVLKKYNITHVVSILSPAGGGAVSLLQHIGISYRRFLLEDEEHADITQFFGPTFRFVNRALRKNNSSTNVLIHCFMGISRSSTLACSYLMRTHQWSATAALEHIRQSRLEASPNPGFLQQLQQFEWDLHFQQTQHQSHQERKYLCNSIIHCFPPAERQHIIIPHHIIRIIVNFLF
jgi:predicted protein tyrosine phosphatase